MLSFLVRIKLVKAIKKKLFLTFILLKKKIFFFWREKKKKKRLYAIYSYIIYRRSCSAKNEKKGGKKVLFYLLTLACSNFSSSFMKNNIYIYIYIYISPLHSIIGLRKYYLRASHPTNIIGLWGYTIRCLGLLYSRRTTCKIFELLYCKVL